MFCCKNTLRYVKNNIIELLLIFVFLSVSIRCYAESEQKKYIFIDGGAHEGESLLAFKTTDLYKKYPWEIFAIEANPYLIENLKKIPSITVINKAMWNKDGTIVFNLAEEDGVSSVYDKHIHQPNELKKIIVESFDFGQWLKRSFSINDFIIVSLDIEGSEYEILDKMLADGTIKYVDRFYIEFHGRMLNQFIEKEKELIEKLNNLGILAADDSVENIVDGRCEEWIDIIEE